VTNGRLDASLGLPPTIISSHNTRNMKIDRAALPLELGEQIIDAVSRDISALKVFSIVHRSWTTRCRQHIFRTIVIRGEQESGRFIESLREFPERISFIREAHLLDGPWRQSGPVWFYGEHGLSRLVPILKDVETLKLQFLDFARLAPDLRDMLSNPYAAAFTRMETLILIRCSFFGYPSFVGFLSALPSLRHLSLEGPRWAHPSEDVPEPDLPSLRLRSLSLSRMTLSPLPPTAAIALARRIEPDAFETLDVDIESIADCEFFSELLAAFGTHVKHLRLHSGVYLVHGLFYPLTVLHLSNGQTTAALYNIYHLRNLRKLALYMSLHNSNGMPVSPLGLLGAVGKRICSIALESMSLMFSPMHPLTSVTFPDYACTEFATIASKFDRGNRIFRIDIGCADEQFFSVLQSNLMQRFKPMMEAKTLNVFLTD
jgi:hypothetical protein